ncbi:MAG: phage tail length tape measure family protein, partial [Hyphomicrobium sp.]
MTEGLGAYTADLNAAAAVTKAATDKIKTDASSLKTSMRDGMGEAGALIEKLKEQTAVFGMSSQELRRYKASVLDTTPGQRQMIDQLLTGIEALEAQKAASMSVASGFGVMASAAAVAAVAVAAIGYAAYKGAQEQLAYQKALILSGNVAGTTAGQMADMARAIGQNVGTQYQAAEALTALAGTGQVAGSSLQKLGEVAVQMQRTMGVSVQDTAKEFAELGREPVKASLKLNEATHYLTASVYEQIKAAQDLGDEERAASLAQDAYATAMAQRMDGINQNLGYLQTAWNFVRDGAKGAWDAMLNLGRETTTAEKIKAITDQLKTFAEVQAMDARGGGLSALDAAKQKTLQDQLIILSKQEFKAQEIAFAEAERVKQQTNSIALSEKADKFASNQVKMQREIAQAKSAFENGNRSDADVANYAQAVAGIADKYKETSRAIGGTSKA